MYRVDISLSKSLPFCAIKIYATCAFHRNFDASVNFVDHQQHAVERLPNNIIFRMEVAFIATTQKPNVWVVGASSDYRE